MAKVSLLLTRVLEGETNAQLIEDELNRVLSLVEGEIIGVQYDELKEDGSEYRLLVTTK